MQTLRNRVRSPITRPHTRASLATGAMTWRKPNVREDSSAPSRQEDSASQSNRAAKPAQSGAAKSSTSVCFNCGRPGHLAANCTAESKSVVRCYACGGVGHLARDCANRKAQSQAQSHAQSQSQTRAQSECASSKSANAIASAGVRCLAVLLTRGDRFSSRFRRARRHRLVLLDDEYIAVRATSEQAANLFVREAGA